MSTTILWCCLGHPPVTQLEMYTPIVTHPHLRLSLGEEDDVQGMNACPVGCAQGFSAKAHPPELKEHHLSCLELMLSSMQRRGNRMGLSPLLLCDDEAVAQRKPKQGLNQTCWPSRKKQRTWNMEYLTFFSSLFFFVQCFYLSMETGKASFLPKVEKKAIPESFTKPHFPLT